jgi:cell division septum initiation protein DivIVA
LKALRAEVERLHAQHAVVSTSNSGSTIDLDRTLIEARRILEDARAEAERERELIIDAAHHHAEEIVRRAQRQFSTEAWEIEKIRLERRRYLSMFKALLNRHLHEVEDLEVEPTSDLEESRPQFATVGMPDGEPPMAFSSVNETGSEEFRSPFSYPQADEPFHA